MNYLIAGASQPLIALADHLEPLGISRELVKDFYGVSLTMAGIALFPVTVAVTAAVSIIFPAFTAVTLGGYVAWGLTFGSSKVVRYIPGISEETKGSIVSILNVIRPIFKVIGMNINLPVLFLLQFGIGLIFTSEDQFVRAIPEDEVRH